MKLNNNLFMGMIALVATILVAVVIIRNISGSQTLSEYAKENKQFQIMTTDITTEDVEGEAASGESKPSEGGVSTKTGDGESKPSESGTVAKTYDGKKADSDSRSNMNTLGFVDEYMGTSDREVYQEGFFSEPIPQIIRDKMKGVSYPLDIDESKISYKDLKYLNILYIDFDGNTQIGELVCNKLIAKDLLEIFYELYKEEYRLERVRLIDDYNADDILSMSDNNTSCFCYRVIDGTDRLSNHAYGMAVDINPFYNPYIVFREGQDDYISPAGSEIYVDRSVENPNPYRIDKNDLAYKLFKEHGFRWGGDWNSSKDYQHFDKKLN